MKNVLQSFFVALGLYSKIPTPKVEWNKGNMKYAYAFFPIIGVIIGLLEYFWFWVCNTYALETLLYSAVAVILPVLITGGIHIDGFVDSCDSFFSYGSREKKIEILADPHVGAFGVIYLIVYFLAVFGVWAQVSVASVNWAMFLTPFVTSRIVGGLIVKLGKPAKKTGLLFTLQNKEEKDHTVLFLLLWAVAIAVVTGAVSLFYLCFTVVSTILFMFCFKRYAYKTIGGFTGDLAGFSIAVIELILTAGIALGGILHWF